MWNKIEKEGNETNHDNDSFVHFIIYSNIHVHTYLHQDQESGDP